MRALVHRDRDDVAGGILLVGDVGTDDPEVSEAVLHVIAADRLLVGGQAIGIVDVGALDERQQVHRAGLHQAAQAVVRNRMVADELDLADARLAAFVDGEDQIHAPVRQLDQPFGHLGFVAAVFLVGVLDAADVADGGLLVVGGVRFRLHFDFKLLRFDLFVAFERDSIDDLLAAAQVDHDLAVDQLRANVGIDARGLQVFDAPLDRRWIGPGEVRLESRGIDVGALNDNLLSARGGRPVQPA